MMSNRSGFKDDLDVWQWLFAVDKTPEGSTPETMIRISLQVYPQMHPQRNVKLTYT